MPPLLRTNANQPSTPEKLFTSIILSSFPAQMQKTYEELKGSFLEALKHPKEAPAIISDADGTLIHTLDTMYDAFLAAHKKITGKDYEFPADQFPRKEFPLGKEYDKTDKVLYPRVRAHIIALLESGPHVKLFASMFTDGPKAHKIYNSELLNCYSKAKLMRGADDAIKVMSDLRQAGMISYLAVGSAQTHACIEAAMENNGVAGCFDSIQGALENGKDKRTEKFIGRIFKDSNIPKKVYVFGDSPGSDGLMADNVGKFTEGKSTGILIGYASEKTTSNRDKGKHHFITGWGDKTKPHKAGVDLLRLAAHDAILSFMKTPEYAAMQKSGSARVSTLEGLEDGFKAGLDARFKVARDRTFKHNSDGMGTEVLTPLSWVKNTLGEKHGWVMGY